MYHLATTLKLSFRFLAFVVFSSHEPKALLILLVKYFICFAEGKHHDPQSILHLIGAIFRSIMTELSKLETSSSLQQCFFLLENFSGVLGCHTKDLNKSSRLEKVRKWGMKII